MSSWCPDWTRLDRKRVNGQVNGESGSKRSGGYQSAAHHLLTEVVTGVLDGLNVPWLMAGEGVGSMGAVAVHLRGGDWVLIELAAGGTRGLVWRAGNFELVVGGRGQVSQAPRR